MGETKKCDKIVIRDIVFKKGELVSTKNLFMLISSSLKLFIRVVGFEMVPERKTRDNQRIGFYWKLNYTGNYKVIPLCAISFQMAWRGGV